MAQHQRWQLRGHGSDAYERYLVPALLTPWATDLLSRVALQLHDRILDVACGTGFVARLAAQQVGASGHVTGVDLNADAPTIDRKSNLSKALFCHGHHWHERRLCTP